MSWDVVLFKVPNTITSVRDVPRDYQPPPLGSHSLIAAALTRVVPSVDLTDPTWGLLANLDWSIELNIGRKDPIDSIMLHIRGGGDDVLTAVFRIAAELDCQVFDCSGGDLISEEDTGNWHAWQDYRDQVIGPTSD